MIMPLWLSRVLQAILWSVVALMILDNGHPYSLVWAMMYYLIGFPFGYWRSIEDLGAHTLLVGVGAFVLYAVLGSEDCLNWLNPTIAPGVMGYLVGRLCQRIPNDAERERLRGEAAK
jgi:hypothetical protein